MARAGFCTECGDNVFLTDEGACPEGHGPECIRDEYAVTDADGPVAEPVVSATEAPAPAMPVIVSEAAPRNRTGMIVFTASAVVLLVALVAAAFVLLPNLNKPKTSSTSKARVETSIAFLSALFADDTMKIKPLLTDEAQTAITAAEWSEIASAFPTVDVAFGETTWSSDATAVVSIVTGEATATLTVGAALDTTDTVKLVLDIAGSPESATLRLVLAKDGWRIVSITDATGGATLYDGPFVQSLLEEARAQ